MNLRQPYEQLIADKLRQLRTPDADASWQQMKRLLDDAEDKGAGGRKRPPGNSGLWRIGILAIVLSASFWLYVEKAPTRGASLSKNNTAISPQSADKSAEMNKANNSAKNKTATIENTTTLKDPNNSNTTANDAAAASTIDDKSIAAVSSKNNTTTALTPIASGSTANHASSAANNTLHATLSSKNSYAKRNTGIAKNDLTTTVSLAENNKTTKKQHSAVIGINDAIAAGAITGNNVSATYTAAGHTNKTKHGAGKTKGSHFNAATDASAFDDNNRSAVVNNAGPVKSTSEKQKIWLDNLVGFKTETFSPSFNTSLAAGDSIEDGRDVNNILNSETKKAVAKAQRDNEIALLDKKDKKGVHLNLSNVFKPFSMRMDAEPWWAAGIAVNANITVHAQNRYKYNINAKSGTGLLSDYIPSPYLQFHLNNYVYFQTELNFITPQFTPQLLAFRENYDLTAQQGVSVERSIYIEKMYYFNWPVSLHYSPIKNLFLSAGLQFSSFQSGLASIQEKQYVTLSGPDHASSVTNEILKFKDDSIAAKIAPNEWRWQLGAEYYINRFSVGLRYNQSFKNTVNTTVSPSLPPTLYRNESLLFFVRYNLFESRNKNSVPKNQ